MNKNIPETDIYQILRTGKLNKIIRHYKVIVRNNYNSSVDKKIKSKNNIETTIYKYKDALSQDTDNYEDENIKMYDSINLNNFYKDETSVIKECNETINNDDHDNNKPRIFQGKHYNSINEIKNDINDLLQLASDNYVNYIINGNETVQGIIDGEGNLMDNSEITNSEDTFSNDIEELIEELNSENKSSLYIRLGANKSEQTELIERILSFNKNGLYDIELALNDGLPIFNDNKAYSNKKYEILKSKFETE